MPDLTTIDDYIGVWEGVAPSSVYDYELDVDLGEDGMVRVFEQRTSFETGVTEVFMAEGSYTVRSGVLENFIVRDDGGAAFHTYTVSGLTEEAFTLGGMFDALYPMRKIAGS